MGANDYMYTGVQRDAAATVSKRQPYCVLINYVASSLFVYVATTLTILRRPIEACYVGMLSRFHPIPECYGRTDGQTDADRFAISISRVTMLTGDKKSKTLVRSTITILPTVLPPCEWKYNMTLPITRSHGSVTTLTTDQCCKGDA